MSGNILYVLNSLKKYSDENHILSSKEISTLILQEYGVKIDSKTVKRAIYCLIERFNYDISTFNDNKIGYYYIKNPDIDFEEGEIQAILDTFSYSNFIPKKFEYSIRNKCLNMLNIYEQEKLKNYKISMKNTKSENLEIIKNIEDVNEAIYENKKISFNYLKYELNPNLEKVIQGLITVSPYKLFYGLSNFYLVCLTNGKEELYTYRIDRMKNIKILTEDVSTKFDENEVDFFIKNNVAMFSGDVEKVIIECDMKLLDNVIELYGKDIKTEKLNENLFKATFYTNIKGFRYWCLRNIEMVKVIEPDYLKKNIIETIKEVLKQCI